MKNKNYLILQIIIFLLPILAYSNPEESGKKFSVNGKITDEHSGEALVGATIFVRELKTG